MTSMFWGLRLEPGKRYTTTVDKSFHVSMAALDCSSVKGDDVLSVMLEEEEANIPYILCNLHKQKSMQAKLDLNFMSGDRVTFFCKGQGTVHLSGYIVPDDDEFGPLENEEEEDEDEEEEEEEESTEKQDVAKTGPKGAGKGKVNGLQVAGKRKTEDAQAPSKKKKVEQEAESDESNDDEDDDLEDEEDDEENPEGMEEDSDGSLEGLEEEEDDEEEEEEEEEESQVTPQSKKNKKNKQQNQQSTPFSKQQTPAKSPKTVNGLPAANQQQSGKKDKKKGGGETPAGTPKANKSISEDTSPQKKTLEGGVTIKDLKVGNGQVCKPGRMATVYYTGRLKSNNKVFDSVMQGPGFKFRVGRGEVIKGWDLGVTGMKVGGKRIITCPPQMAYGAKGSPPSIPGNTGLVFEVELKAMN